MQCICWMRREDCAFTASNPSWWRVFHARIFFNGYTIFSSRTQHHSLMPAGNQDLWTPSYLAELCLYPGDEKVLRNLGALWISASFDMSFPWPSNVDWEQKPVVTPSTIGVVDEDKHHVLRPGTVVKLDNWVVDIRSRFGKVQGLIDPNTTRVMRRSVGPFNWLKTLSHCLPAGACVSYFPTCQECYCMHRPMQPCQQMHTPTLTLFSGSDRHWDTN